MITSLTVEHENNGYTLAKAESDRGISPASSY